MKHLKTAALAAALCTAFGLGALAQPPAGAPAPKAPAPQPPVTGTIGPIPANLKPNRISGPAINCADFEKQKEWYTTVLGMTVVQTLERNGKPFEYLLSTDKERGSNAILALLNGKREPGATTYGRVIFGVADGEATAAHLRSHGVAVRKVAVGAYFLNDPEGNLIELFQTGATS